MTPRNPDARATEAAQIAAALTCQMDSDPVQDAINDRLGDAAQAIYDAASNTRAVAYEEAERAYREATAHADALLAMRRVS